MLYSVELQQLQVQDPIRELRPRMFPKLKKIKASHGIKQATSKSLLPTALLALTPTLRRSGEYGDGQRAGSA